MSGAVFLFGKDLRLTDNYGLNNALKENEQILPLYVWDRFFPPPNRFVKSWLLNSLHELGNGLGRIGSRLTVRSGDTANILTNICLQHGINKVYVTEPTYTLGSMEYEKLKHILNCQGVTLVLIRDNNLRFISKEPEIRQFKQFQNLILREMKVGPVTEINQFSSLLSINTLEKDVFDFGETRSRVDFGNSWSPGWEHANSKMNIIDSVDFVNNYKCNRQSLDESRAIRLSPYLVNGEISYNTIFYRGLRQAKEIDSGENPFLRQICWNLFAKHTYKHNPNLHTHSIRPVIDQLPWTSSVDGLKKWKEGLTGYPIVDAGMRELRQTGWIHNRIRMITASFLIKHLLVHWTEGADWFYDNLLDADVPSNYFNWQYMAGSMRESNPYFRIFNPVLQGKKFDPNGKYVKRWIPELRDYPKQLIHEPWKYNPVKTRTNSFQKRKIYPEPVVEHMFARTRALSMFRKYLKKGDN